MAAGYTETRLATGNGRGCSATRKDEIHIPAESGRKSKLARFEVTASGRQLVASPLAKGTLAT